jgi:hypothetical protein
MPLAYSYLNCNGGTCVELNSVGHVNHTAIYLLIVYAISLSLLVFNFKNIGNFLRATLVLISVVLFYVVIDTHSRAASGLIVIITLMALLYSIYYYRNWTSLIVSVLLISLASVVLVYNPPPVVNKFINGTDLVGDSPRQKIRNHSYYVYKSNPILGVGFGNYVHFGHDEIKEIVISEEGEYDSNKFLPSAHPHNVYYTYLVSGGLIMSSIFILFWLNILQIIYSFNKGSNEKWLIFSSVGVVMTVLGVGLVNTTLAHEHALIAMFVLGLLISRYRKLI